MTNHNEEPIAILRELFEETPSLSLFKDVMDYFSTWSQVDDLQVLIDYALEHMASWPPAYRAWKKWLPQHPGWPLIRSFDYPHASQFKNDKGVVNEFKRRLPSVAPWSHIHWLYDSDALAPIASSKLAHSLNHLELTIARDMWEVGRGLEAFPNLTHLTLRAPYTSLIYAIDMPQLGKLTKLRHLELTQFDLQNQEFPNTFQLETLTLRDCQTPFAALAALHQNTKLHFQTSQHGQREKVSTCTQLSSLTFYSDDVTEETEFGGFTQLDTLTMPILDYCDEPEDLFTLTQLRELTLSAGPESQETWPETTLDLAQLSGFVNLEALDVSRRYVKHVEALEALVQLKHLSLHGCERCPDLEWLATLTDLIELSLPGGHEHLSFLSGLKRLQKLELKGAVYGDGEILEDNTLNDLSVLTHLTELRELHINAKTELHSLDLSQCRKLRILSISDCPALASIQGLWELPKIRSITLEDCPLFIPSTDSPSEYYFVTETRRQTVAWQRKMRAKKEWEDKG